jgi:hypothetical protein
VMILWVGVNTVQIPVGGEREVCTQAGGCIHRASMAPKPTLKWEMPHWQRVLDHMIADTDGGMPGTQLWLLDPSTSYSVSYLTEKPTVLCPSCEEKNTVELV